MKKSRVVGLMMAALLSAALIAPLAAQNLSYSKIVEPVIQEHKTYYDAKRRLLRRLDRQGDLSGPEYFVLGISCQVDDTPSHSILLSMTKAAKCGQYVPEYFAAAGRKGVPAGFYEASKKMQDPLEALQFGLLALAFSEPESMLEAYVRRHLSELVNVLPGSNEVIGAVAAAEQTAVELLASGAYEQDHFSDSVLDAEYVAALKSEAPSVGTSSVAGGGRVVASADGPFGLTFGMSAAEVQLQAVETDKYGRERLAATRAYYSCNSQLLFMFNGNYVYDGMDQAETQRHLKMFDSWLDVAGRAHPDAAKLMTETRRSMFEPATKDAFLKRYRIGGNYTLNDEIGDIKIRNFVTESGITLCLAFFQDQLFRVAANMSGKRDLLPQLIDRFSQDYAGAPHTRLRHKGLGMQTTTVLRWAGDPEGVWLTVQYDDYTPPEGADFSRAYAFGGIPTPPMATEMEAKVEYTYLPLFSRMLANYYRSALDFDERQRLEDQQRRDRALQDF